MPAVRSSAPSPVVHPGNHIHDDGKGQEAQKRYRKTIHTCVSPPRSLEKVNPPK
jgi:hypothetical protein